MERSNKQIEKELFEIVEKRKGLVIKKQKILRDMLPLRREMRRIKEEHLRNILEAVDSKGKPIYSNRDKRNAEWGYRLDRDEKFNSLRDKLRTFERDFSDIGIEFDYLAEKRESLLLIIMLRTGKSVEDIIGKKDSLL